MKDVRVVHLCGSQVNAIEEFFSNGLPRLISANIAEFSQPFDQPLSLYTTDAKFQETCGDEVLMCVSACFEIMQTSLESAAGSEESLPLVNGKGSILRRVGSTGAILQFVMDELPDIVFSVFTYVTKPIMFESSMERLSLFAK